MLTKKHYIELARIFGRALAVAEGQAEKRGVMLVEKMIEQYLKEDNWRFDGARFAKAVSDYHTGTLVVKTPDEKGATE